MKTFVQSRGHSPDFEYCWQPEVPPQLSNISSLIQSESPSIVLARFDSKLMLLVTGLESPEKKDFRERPIRHSVVWVCDEDYDNEMQIRAIATKFLRGVLVNQVDNCIQLGGENGFEVSTLEIEALGLLSVKGEDIECLPLPSLDLRSKIGKNSQKLRDDLAYTLQRHSLPKKTTILIVATGVKSEQSLEEIDAWRSLSKLVKSDSWRDLDRREVEKTSFFGLAIAMTVAVIVVAALILLVVLHPFTPKPVEVIPSPIPTTSPTNQTMKETPQILQKKAFSN